MCFMFGKDKELVGGHCLLFPVEFKPTLSLYTIDKDKFVCFRIRAFTIMEAGMRIITDIGYSWKLNQHKDLKKENVL